MNVSPKPHLTSTVRGTPLLQIVDFFDQFFEAQTVTALGIRALDYRQAGKGRDHRQPWFLAPKKWIEVIKYGCVYVVPWYTIFSARKSLVGNCTGKTKKGGGESACVGEPWFARQARRGRA